MNLDIDRATDDELDGLLEELESLAHTSPLDYIPHPENPLTGFKGMYAFHTSPRKIRFLSGGNQSGKTVAGAIEAIFHSTGIYPAWYPTNQRWDRPTLGRIVVQDFKIFTEVVERKFLELIPKELIADVKHGVGGNTQKYYIRHTSGSISEITIMTYEQDDEAFEGWTGDWAWFDEPPPREKFVATQRGLIARKGRCWLTLTPISQPWLYDDFVIKDDPTVLYMTVDIADNPHLTSEEVKIFESRLTDDEKEARLHGKFKHLSGRIYKIFDPAIHVISEKNVKIDSRWPTYFVLDPADRRPHHALWAKIDPFGTIYIVDEIVFKGTILEVSKEILRREIMNNIKPLEVIRILDPNKGETPSAVSGLKLKDEFANHAIYFLTNVNDDLTLGHLAVSERLSWDKSKPLSTTNHPKLFLIKEHTTNTVHQILTYVWDEWLGKTRDSKSQKEKPKDINKDLPDCIRYLVVFNPSFSLNDEKDPTPYKSTSRTGYT